MREGWKRKAACRGHPDPEIWYNADTDPATQICARCPVRSECLEYALGLPVALVCGVWGGCDERQLRLLRDRQRRPRKATV